MGGQGIQVAALSIPLHDVDGDFYDFHRYGDRYVDVVIGDAMGKGPSAAAVGEATRASLRRCRPSIAPVADDGVIPDPQEIVSRIQREMTGPLMEIGSFVTLLYARFDLGTRRVTFVDCGHPLSGHLDFPSKGWSALEGENLPLGVDGTDGIRQSCRSYEDGDLFVLYSDGLIEAQDESGEPFGEARLREVVRANSRLDPEDIVETVRAAVRGHISPRGLSDDLTCVVLKT